VNVELRRDSRPVESGLFLNVVHRRKEFELFAQASLPVDMPVEKTGEKAGGAVEVQALPARIEVVYPLIPNAPTCRVEKGPELSAIDLPVSGNASCSKHLKEVVVGKVPHGCQLEFQQSRLMRVQVYAVDPLRGTEQVVECIASGAGDHDDPIGGCDVQRLLVHGGIFPTLVVDQVSLVDLFEEPLFHDTSRPLRRCCPMRQK